MKQRKIPIQIPIQDGLNISYVYYKLQLAKIKQYLLFQQYVIAHLLFINNYQNFIMNIVPPKLQTSQIPIIRKNLIIQPSQHQVHYQAPLIRNNQHQLSPAAKIVLHSPQAHTDNRYLHHLLPNSANEQHTILRQPQPMQTVAKIGDNNFIPYLQKKDLGMAGQINEGRTNQGKSIIKIMTIGNASSAATRSRGISQISVNKSLQHRTNLSQAYRMAYKTPSSPFKILQDVPVTITNQHNITHSDQNRTHRSNSQNIHIKIESNDPNPLPSSITVTHTTPLNPIIVHPHPHIIHHPYPHPNPNPNPYQQHTLVTNPISSQYRNANQPILQAQPDYNNNPQLQVNSSKKKVLKNARFQSDMAYQAREKINSITNMIMNGNGQVESKSLDKNGLSKSTFIQKLYIEADQQKPSPIAHTFKGNLDQYKESIEMVNKQQLNHREYYNNEYNNDYYNIQMPSCLSNSSELAAVDQKDLLLGYIHRQKLFANSRRLINEIFENETNKALLNMKRIEMRSGDRGGKSSRRRKIR